MKKVKKIFLYWCLIPFTLVILAIVLTLIFFLNSDINPNILSSNYKLNQIGQTNVKISGYFKSEHDYLGIITIPFRVNYKLNGISVFRIKNILDNDWYHTATISANQYYAIPSYTFGLPVINNSKNQTYKFEIELPDSNPKLPGLKINESVPYFKSNYVYPRELLMQNKSLLLGFIKNKSLYYLQDSNAWRVLLVYFLPLFLYFLIYRVGLIKLFDRSFKAEIFSIIKQFKKPSFLIFLSGVFIDIFIARSYSDSIVLSLLAAFLLTIISYNNQADLPFFLALILLLFCPFLIWARMDWIAEKSAIWAYLFMIAGTFQGLIKLGPLFIKIYKISLIRLLANYIGKIINFFDWLITKFAGNFYRRICKFFEPLFQNIPNTFIGWVKLITKIILLLVIFCVIFVLISLVGIEAYRLYRIKDHQRIRQTLNPDIKILEPKLVYKATFIVIYGKNLDWKTDDNIYLMVDGIKANVSLWTNSEIVFQVPLNWKIGEHQAWIEKPIVWDGQQELAKSAAFQFKVLPITGKITKDDSLYFDQLNTLRKETLKLNGYN